jgi:hypothetical protein
MRETDIRLFGTYPQPKDVLTSDYRQRVRAVARWGEDAG